MEQQPQLNDHNKQEYPPMHTAEHLLNATMVKTFGCPRSRNAHIERKKLNTGMKASGNVTSRKCMTWDLNLLILPSLPGRSCLTF